MALPQDIVDAMDAAAQKSRAERETPPRPAPTTDHLVKWADLPAALLEANESMMQLIILPMRKRIEVLESELKTLQARPTVKYLGVHKPGATYSEGSLVTRDGSIFHANKLTGEAPGDGCQDWTLCCKRGRDGRDGKDTA